MNKNDFKRVFALASRPDFSYIGIDTEPLWELDCKGFKEVMVPIRVAAAFVKYHCICINGEWDSVELDNMSKTFRRKVILLD